MPGGQDSYDDALEGAKSWLQYIHDFLTNRKLYHKRQQIKRKMLTKVAQEHLSPDELAEIDKTVDALLSKEAESDVNIPDETVDET